MKQELFQLTLVVNDYDEAISFYTNKLGFELIEDTKLTETKRWVRVGPAGPAGFCLLLAEAVTTEQKKYVGNQTGGRVFLFMRTDDCLRDYRNLLEKGVEFVRVPSVETFGTVAVFKDLYGNLWDLIGPA